MDTATALRLGVVTLWLTVCAYHDWRTRTVPNALTVPPFVLAWPVAYVLHGISGLWLTGFVFAVTYFMFRAGMMGPADGKALTTLVAVVPETLVPLILVHAAVALYLRWKRMPNARVPGMVLYLAGVLLAPVVLGRVR